MSATNKTKPILAESPDWELWYMSVSALARSLNVWDICDPSPPQPPPGAATSPPQARIPKPLVMPKEPELHESADATALALYDRQYRAYQNNSQNYERQVAALNLVRNHITETVDQKWASIYLKESSVKSMLEVLQEKLKPADEAHQRYLYQSYQTMLGSFKRSNLGNWLTEYEILLNNCIEANVPELLTTSRQAIDFLATVKHLSPAYADTNSTLRIRDHESIKGWGGIKFATDFRIWIRDMMPEALMKQPKGSFPTFQGPNESGKSNRKKQPSQGHLPPDQRVCHSCSDGSKHRPSVCPYFNPERRKPGWSGTEEGLQRARSALSQFPNLKAAVENQIRDDQQKAKPTAPASTKSSNESAGQALNAATVSTTAWREDDDEVFHLTCSAIQQKIPLHDSVIFDTGSHYHVFNDQSRFENLKPDDFLPELTTGGGIVKPVAHGTAIVKLGKLNDDSAITLHVEDALYCPDFPLNIISSEKFENKGIYMITETGEIYRKKSNKKQTLGKLTKHFGMWCFEYHPIAAHSFVAHSSAKPKPTAEATATLWHQRLGHPSPEALQHINSIGGAALQGPATIECEYCSQAHGKQIISRRPPLYKPTYPFESIHIDFFSLNAAYNGMKTILGLYDSFSMTLITRALPKRSHGLQTIISLITRIQRQYGIAVRCIRTDDDSSLRSSFEEWATDEGIIIERSAPYTPAQNGSAERAGGVLFEKARALRAQSGFPESLWPEIIQATTYLLNRTPRKRLGWRAPESALNQWLNQHRAADRPADPLISHIRKYGCRAYPLTTDALRHSNRSDKTAPRAHIGYLCGYESTNIFRIWIPVLDTVICTRDVTFNEQVMYDPRSEDLSELARSAARVMKQIYDLQTPPAAAAARRYDLEAADDVIMLPGIVTDKLTDQPTNKRARNTNSSLLTPEPSPEPPQPTGGVGDTEPDEPDEPQPEIILPEIIVRTDSPTEPQAEPHEQHQPEPHSSAEPHLIAEPHQMLAPDSSEPLAEPHHRPTPEPTHTEISAQNILPTSRRSQKPKPDASTTSAFHASFNSFAATHQRDLPPPPRNWAEAMKHQFAAEWQQAAQSAYKDLQDRGVFLEVPAESIQSQDQNHPVLPLKWVFTYKLDSHGFLLRCKARLCVRGDLQPFNNLDTYASTLAARSFRCLMAFAAYFNLDTRQLDAMNAYTNSTLDETVYVWPPPGFKKQGVALLVLRALYGLRRAALLWQRELASTFKQLNLKPVPEDDCIYQNEQLTLFVFVDDIVILFKREHQQAAEQLIQGLKQAYDMHDLGELKWFLGIRILRDRAARKLWLCQDSYIEQMAARYHLQDRKHQREPRTPMGVDNLRAFEGSASPDQIQLYQGKIGSINYPAVITRPDVARPAARLAEFLLNPGPEHQEAADQVIRYLYATRFLSIEFNAEPAEAFLTCSSDAAFADDPDNRRSTQGYVMSLFNGPIFWRASKQRSVVTSSTEAELVALTQATREYISLTRLLKQLQLDLEEPQVIGCDNQQTLRILTSDRPHLNSRLKHINIQQLWLRQICQSKAIAFKWVPTDQMIADGLTKALPAQRHQQFVKQLNLKDLSSIINISKTTKSGPSAS